MTDEYETVTDHEGFVWENGGSETDDHLAWGGHEPALLQIAKTLLPENGVFLDVGAHVGMYTIRLAQKAKTVYAIEANPRTYEVLMRNIERNANENSDYRCLNVAAWDGFDVLTMVDENGKSTGGSTRCELRTKHESRFMLDETHTQAIPLDNARPDELIPADFVKIDVEGAEGRVLVGLTKTIAAFRPILFIEMHDKVYNKPEVRQDVLRFLYGADYTWDDSLTYGSAYYIIAHPSEAKAFEPEVVHAGDSD